jgi:phage terminase large subunit
MSVEIHIPPALHSTFKGKPLGTYRYRGAYGGRGSGKSFTFAKMAAVFGYQKKRRILCVREYQNSIKDSFHQELKNAIESEPWLEANYDVGVDYIRGKNGTEFIFKGLFPKPQSIKSLAQIDICIVEEAEDVSAVAWQTLKATIRAEGSEIWVIWNPKRKDSPCDAMFIQNQPARSSIVKMNYSDNPWFPSVLEEERQNDIAILDRATYSWIWEGAYLQHSAAQVFRDKYEVQAFTPKDGWQGAYFGLDFGFSQDPTAGVKCWIADNRLYIEHEAVKKGLELDDTAGFIIEHLPDASKHIVRADSARPESISYLKRHGLPNITAVEKGKGSVEDGIEFIKSFERIIIHPRCTETLKEFDLYSYKTDRLSGDVMPVLEDRFNHCIDALRYALEPIMKARSRPVQRKGFSFS